MGSTDTFDVVVTAIERANASMSIDLRGQVARVQDESDAISELMSFSRELAEPQPTYFTRG